MLGLSINTISSEHRSLISFKFNKKFYVKSIVLKEILFFKEDVHVFSCSIYNVFNL